ncbi:MAG: hypothetical protein HYY24_19025 [Verrucomicrobia bacterium]|nr:hypothetical protein [Verrucomicrobiota bacterium]
MQAIEFETELHGQTSLAIPAEVAAQLPDSGRAKVILLLKEDEEDAVWRKAAYEQFMRDDSPEDSVYDRYV